MVKKWNGSSFKIWTQYKKKRAWNWETSSPPNTCNLRNIKWMVGSTNLEFLRGRCHRIYWYINETTWLSRQRRDSKFCKNNWAHYLLTLKIDSDTPQLLSTHWRKRSPNWFRGYNQVNYWDSKWNALTYKYSQDHIELFSCIRSRGGCLVATTTLTACNCQNWL